MRKTVSVVALMVLPTVAALSFAGVASALINPVKCTHLTGNFVTGTNATVSGCNDPANTGGKGTIPFGALIGGVGSTGKITWNGKGTTSIKITALTSVSPDVCPTDPEGMQESEFLVKASVTGGTGAAIKSILKGWTMQAHVCVNTDSADANYGSITLVSGTDFFIGSKY